MNHKTKAAFSRESDLTVPIGVPASLPDEAHLLTRPREY